MGSPLGVLFANFYLGSIEEKVINDINKPLIYCRYIDDISILSKTEENIQQIKNLLTQNSVLTRKFLKPSKNSHSKIYTPISL